ncbi:putative addiction module component [compost metagenome]
MSANLKVPPEFDQVSKEQRIAFVQELWDRIAQDAERVPLPAEHQRILEERLAEYRANPRAGRPWSEVRDQLLAKLRRS